MIKCFASTLSITLLTTPHAYPISTPDRISNRTRYHMPGTQTSPGDGGFRSKKAIYLSKSFPSPVPITHPSRNTPRQSIPKQWSLVRRVGSVKGHGLESTPVQSIERDKNTFKADVFMKMFVLRDYRQRILSF